MDDDRREPATYASPPCFMHEIDPAWSGLAPDPDTPTGKQEAKQERMPMTDRNLPTTLSRKELERVGAEALLGIPDAVVMSDRDGIITLWNEGATRLFGFSADQALGQSLDIIIPQRLQQRHWEGYNAMLRSGRSTHDAGELLNVPALTRKRETISVQFTVAPVTDGKGTITGVISIMRDFTETREELRRLRTLENER